MYFFFAKIILVFLEAPCFVWNLQWQTESILKRHPSYIPSGFAAKKIEITSTGCSRSWYSQRSHANLFSKKVVLKNFANSLGNTYTEVSFNKVVLPQCANLPKQKTSAKVFSCEFCEMFWYKVFIEPWWVTSSGQWLLSFFSFSAHHYAGLTLTHFSPVSHFYTPWKRQKTFGFLTFSGVTEMWHCTKIG